MQRRRCVSKGQRSNFFRKKSFKLFLVGTTKGCKFASPNESIGDDIEDKGKRS